MVYRNSTTPSDLVSSPNSERIKEGLLRHDTCPSASIAVPSNPGNEYLALAVSPPQMFSASLLPYFTLDLHGLLWSSIDCFGAASQLFTFGGLVDSQTCQSI
jgi:hypothetical protein